MATQHSLRTTVHSMKADFLTPVLIFKRLQGQRKFLLESSSKFEEVGRYSFIGANPRKTYYGEQTTLHDFTHSSQQHYTYDGPLIQSLKQVMPRVSSHTEFPFIGGAIGYIRYGAGTERAQLDTTMPEVQFHIYDTLIIFDHIKDEVTIVHTDISAEHETTNLDSIITSLQQSQVATTETFDLGPLQHATTSTPPATAQADFSGDAFELYRKLRVQMPGAYMYYVEFDDHSIIGSSADSLIAVAEEQIKAPHIEQEVFAKVATTIQNDGLLTATLQPGLHSLDALQVILPPKQAGHSESSYKAFGSVVGYIGFNGQIDFTLANNVLVITSDTLQLETTNENFPALTDLLSSLKG